FWTSYFLGNRKDEWRHAVVNYSRVRYTGVYPGIDLVYYGSGGDLEYDFIVQPDADPNRIRLKFQGVERLSVNSAGDLVIRTAAGQLTQRRPVVYQTGREIQGRFKLLSKNVVGFAIEPYDRSAALTIDPVLTYASLLGGSGGDAVVAAKIDKSGFVLLEGYVRSTTFVELGDLFLCNVQCLSTHYIY